jgi:hypothetical protein
MKVGFVVAALVVLLFGPPVRAEPKNLDDLLGRCAKKTVVMGRAEKGEIVEVGKRLDGYCAGFLDRAFAMLIKAKNICAEKSADSSSDFLVSLVETYRAQKGVGSEDAASAVEAAFRRHFSCAVQPR